MALVCRRIHGTTSSCILVHPDVRSGLLTTILILKFSCFTVSSVHSLPPTDGDAVPAASTDEEAGDAGSVGELDQLTSLPTVSDRRPKFHWNVASSKAVHHVTFIEVRL